jgi:hypothetical protein
MAVKNHFDGQNSPLEFIKMYPIVFLDDNIKSRKTQNLLSFG